MKFRFRNPVLLGRNVASSYDWSASEVGRVVAIILTVILASFAAIFTFVPNVNTASYFDQEAADITLAKTTFVKHCKELHRGKPIIVQEIDEELHYVGYFRTYTNPDPIFTSSMCSVIWHAAQDAVALTSKGK